MSSSPSSSGATEYEVSYVLPEPFDCEKLENSSSIVFDADYNGKAYSVKGFTLTVMAKNEHEMKEKANKKAERLVQNMTLKGRGYVKYVYEGFRTKTPNASGRRTLRKEFTGSYHIRAMIDKLDLNSNQAISSIMQNDQDMQRYHVRLAKEAEENGQYANMYKELFQVIEKEILLKDYNKYKSLRDALSHQTELDRAKPKVEKYFGKRRYDFTTNDEFDHNSTKNRENLKKDAEDLKDVVIEHLDINLR